MTQSDDLKRIEAWAKEMGEQGIYNKNTAVARISSFNNFVSILGASEPKDAQSILNNLDDIATRWSIKTNANPKSIPSFKSRVRVLLKDYIKYQKDPASMKPRKRGLRQEKGEQLPKNRLPKQLKKDFLEPALSLPPSSANNSIISPALHIDIQIHISADTKPEQIELIFKSMAEHLYNKKS